MRSELERAQRGMERGVAMEGRSAGRSTTLGELCGARWVRGGEDGSSERTTQSSMR
jgi:hypothetical protein